jgi:hypothetical protein
VTLVALAEWSKKHWFWIALLVVVTFGYQIGKDRALRDNKSEQSSLSDR